MRKGESDRQDYVRLNESTFNLPCARQIKPLFERSDFRKAVGTPYRNKGLRSTRSTHAPRWLLNFPACAKLSELVDPFLKTAFRDTGLSFRITRISVEARASRRNGFDGLITEPLISVIRHATRARARARTFRAFVLERSRNTCVASLRKGRY